MSDSHKPKSPSPDKGRADSASPAKKHLKREIEAYATTRHEIQKYLISLKAGLSLIKMDSQSQPQVLALTGQLLSQLDLLSFQTGRLLDVIGPEDEGGAPTLEDSPSLGETVNLAELITRTFENIRTKRNQTDAELKWLGGETRLRTRSKRLKEVLEEIFENAFAYSQIKIPKVSVQVKSDTQNLTIEIEDGGNQISPDDRSQLGRIFFRGESAIRSRPLGAGLGILRIQKLLTPLSGKFSLVDSQPGKNLWAIRFPIALGQVN